MMNVNIEMKDLKSRRYIAKPEPMQQDYVSHALPTSAIEESVMKPVLPNTQNVQIKTNREIPLDTTTVDMTNLPLQDDIEEAQDRDIVAEAYIEVEEAMKTHDKDLPYTTANKHYFLQKIAQYKALYNEVNVDARINRKLTALENYFRDPSSSGDKWTNLNDVVVYGGINTGLKFSAYLEYFILRQEQRSENCSSILPTPT